MNMQGQAKSVGDVIIEQGPWAALAWFLFCLFITAVVWYVRTQRKVHKDQLNTIVKTKDEQIKAVTESGQKMLEMGKQLSEGNLPALKKIEEEIIKIKKVVYDSQNKMDASKTCPLTDVERRRNVIEDIGEEIVRKRA